MTNAEITVLSWLAEIVSESGNIIDAIIELDGSFDSIPEDVCYAYESMSYKEKVGIIHRATKYALQEPTKRKRS